MALEAVEFNMVFYNPENNEIIIGEISSNSLRVQTRLETLVYSARVITVGSSKISMDWVSTLKASGFEKIGEL